MKEKNMKKKNAKIISLILVLAFSFSFTSLPADAFTVSQNISSVSAASNIKLTKKTLTLKLNKGKRLRVKNAPGKVRWKSDKKSVATVTNKGFVKAVGHGKAVIKAYVKVGSKTRIYKCKVTVPYTFANNNLLAQHYQKPGIDMGFQSAASYQKAAGKVIENKDSLHKQSADDDTLYFLEYTGEFVVVSKWGFIRTYFIPNDGKYYYDKQ